MTISSLPQGDTPSQWQRSPQDHALRPRGFDEFIGQNFCVDNLKVFIQGAMQREEALDHVLLSGPPGLGKTTLAQLIAIESNCTFKITSGPILTKPGDLAAFLTQLKPRDVLFIDEIHRLPIAVEELLYSAMEDYRLDILVGEGPQARSLSLPISPFTLVGATTRSGLLSSPLRTRFGICLSLSFYPEEALAKLLLLAAQKLGIIVSPAAAVTIARCSRGTPRVALTFLRRVRDFAQLQTQEVIQEEMAQFALNAMGVTNGGLDVMDRRYLETIYSQFACGPVGIESLSAVLSETKETIEDVVEPYLLQQGLIQRTPRGRVLTLGGKKLVEETLLSGANND